MQCKNLPPIPKAERSQCISVCVLEVSGETKKKKKKKPSPPTPPNVGPMTPRTSPPVLTCPDGTIIPGRWLADEDEDVDYSSGVVEKAKAPRRQLAGQLPKCKTKCRKWKHDPQKQRCISICVVSGMCVPMLKCRSDEECAGNLTESSCSLTGNVIFLVSPVSPR